MKKSISLVLEDWREQNMDGVEKFKVIKITNSIQWACGQWLTVKEVEDLLMYRKDLTITFFPRKY